MGLVDVPSITTITTSINPDNSEPLNCPNANSTTNTKVINHIRTDVFQISLSIIIHTDYNSMYIPSY